MTIQTISPYADVANGALKWLERHEGAGDITRQVYLERLLESADSHGYAEATKRLDAFERKMDGLEQRVRSEVH